MKNNRKTSLIAFLIACLLLVGGAVGFIAGAEGDAQTVEIVGRNLYYGGELSIMYAVDNSELTDGQYVAMRIYDGYPGAEGVTEYTVTDYEISTDEAVLGAKVFYSPEIPLKHMTMVIFAQAVIFNADGSVAAESAVDKYSALEYIYERQFKYDSENTAAMKAFYSHLYYTGEYAQQVLNYATGESPDDYCYVTATDGNYMGFTAGTVKRGTEIQVAYTGSDETIVGWSVVGVYVDDDFTVQSGAPMIYSLTDTIPVNGNLIFTPVDASVMPTDYRGNGVYYNDATKEGQRFDCSTTGTAYNDNWGSGTVSDGALAVDNTAGGLYELHWKELANEKNGDKTKAVVEFDVKFDTVNSTESTYGTRFKVIFDGGRTSGTPRVVQLVYKNIDEDTLDFAGVTFNKHLWYNIRAEIDLDTNELKFYVNGNLQYTAGASSGMHSGTFYGETTGDYMCRVQYVTDNATYKDVLYMDNVYVHFE